MLDFHLDRALVVLIDSDSARGDLFRSWLCGEGYQVEQFFDGEACLRALSQPFPEAVFFNLDPVLPGGMRLLGALHHRMPRVPLIVRVSSSSEQEVAQVLREGAYDFLADPIFRLRLLTTITQAVTVGFMNARIAFLERQLGLVPKGLAPEWAWHESVEEVPTLQAVEMRAIQGALETCDGNVSAAARQLGIGRTTLYRKLEKYRIQRD